MKLTEALEKVWKAINKIENIDFDQTGEDIKDDLLGIHRKFRKQDGVMDEVTDCLQELREVVDEYKSVEEELGIDLITLFEALKNGVYWKGSGIFSPKKIGIYFEEKPELDIENKMLRHILYQCNFDNVKLKDYGKSWALTKEELED